MVFSRQKKGQAAIEFLMTYGWMLLVVLIVGALIFSFVDFNSLLPNKLEFHNNLKGQPQESLPYSNEYSGNTSRQDKVMIVFSYVGAKRKKIAADSGTIQTTLQNNCNSTKIENLDTGDVVKGSNSTSFLNGQSGMMTFDCSSVNGGTGLIKGDVLEGTITIQVKNPLTGLDVPSTGSIRLKIAQ